LFTGIDPGIQNVRKRLHLNRVVIEIMTAL
jgi:hypothetical protein